LLESRYVEPLAKIVAIMLNLEIAMDGGYITLCKNRSKGTERG
jgi:hypothetical protein